MIEVAALPETDVLVFRGFFPDESFLETLREGLAAIGRKQPLIVTLPEGATMDFLDQDRMREAGWVRVDELKEGNAS